MLSILLHMRVSLGQMLRPVGLVGHRCMFFWFGRHRQLPSKVALVIREFLSPHIFVCTSANTWYNQTFTFFGQSVIVVFAFISLAVHSFMCINDFIFLNGNCFFFFVFVMFIYFYWPVLVYVLYVGIFLHIQDIGLSYML